MLQIRPRLANLKVSALSAYYYSDPSHLTLKFRTTPFHPGPFKVTLEGVSISCSNSVPDTTLSSFQYPSVLACSDQKWEAAVFLPKLRTSAFIQGPRPQEPFSQKMGVGKGEGKEKFKGNQCRSTWALKA